MATIDFVQSAQDIGNSGSSVTAVFDGAVTGTNAIIVLVFWKTNQTITSVTDTLSNTYGDSGAGRVTRPVDGYVQVYGAPNIAGGAAPTITVNFSGSITECDVYLIEYSGAAASSMFDVYASGTATSGSTVSTSQYDPVVTSGVIVTLASGNPVSPNDPVYFTGGESYTTRELNATYPESQGVADAIFTSDIGTEITTCHFDTSLQSKAVIIACVIKAADYYDEDQWVSFRVWQETT